MTVAPAPHSGGLLDPAAAALLVSIRKGGFPGWAYLTIQQARAMMASMRPLAGEPEPVEHVEDLVIPGSPDIPARFYRPQGDHPLALVVYFHAGGWALGDCDDIDATVRALANRSQCAVLSVNYRLAPEHKYPAAVVDALAAVEWASRHAGKYGCDGGRLAVMGDSVGGTLAAVVALQARDNNGPRIALQVMVYPALDHAYDTPSYQQFGSSWGVLTRTDMIWFHSHYLSHPDQLDLPSVSPLRSPNLSGLPRALMILPECDPLRDEGLHYVEALQKAGVAAEARIYPGMVHGFWQLGGVLPPALTAIDDIAGVLRSHLTSQASTRTRLPA